MRKSPAPINLLVKKKTTADTVLEWALTTGRFIIILTETIALTAFAYRFVLDRQIIDLHDKIRQKQAILSFYKEDEEKFRLLHNKLATVSTLDSQAQVTPTLVDELVKLAEGKAILQNLRVTPTDAEMIAETPSIPLMNSLITGLKQHPRVIGVSVDSVENDPTTGKITLTIQTTFGDKKGQNAN